eukprot:gene17979-20842_t
MPAAATFSDEILFIQFYFIQSLRLVDKGTKPVAKAAKAAGALKKGSGRKATRVHTKVHFNKPKNLKLARKPKDL